MNNKKKLKNNPKYSLAFLRVGCLQKQIQKSLPNKYHLKMSEQKFIPCKFSGRAVELKPFKFLFNKKANTQVYYHKANSNFFNFF